MRYTYPGMARKLAFVNQKGGVGKTTTAVNVASYLALAKYKVLFIDSDPQANATSGFGIDPRRLDRGIYDVLIDGRKLRDVIFQTPIESLHIVPATIALAGAGVELVPLPDRESKLASGITSIETYYDYIIIDCPPSLDLLTLNALVAAREVVIPVQCEYFALEGLTQLLETIRLIQQNLHPNLNVTGAVITMLDRRNKLSLEVVKEIREHFPFHVFTATIPRNVKLAEAPSFGKPIALYDQKSSGAQAYEELTKEIIALADQTLN